MELILSGLWSQRLALQDGDSCPLVVALKELARLRNLARRSGWTLVWSCALAKEQAAKQLGRKPRNRDYER